MINQLLGGDDLSINVQHHNTDVNVVGGIQNTSTEINLRQRIINAIKKHLVSSIIIILSIIIFITTAFVFNSVYDVFKTAAIIAAKGLAINTISSVIALKLADLPLNTKYIRTSATIGALTGAVGGVLATGMHNVFELITRAL